MKKVDSAKCRNEVYTSKTLTIPVTKISYIIMSENGKYTCKTTDGGSFQMTATEYEKISNFLKGKDKDAEISETKRSGRDA